MLSSIKQNWYSRSDWQRIILFLILLPVAFPLFLVGGALTIFIIFPLALFFTRSIDEPADEETDTPPE